MKRFKSATFDLSHVQCVRTLVAAQPSNFHCTRKKTGRNTLLTQSPAGVTPHGVKVGSSQNSWIGFVQVATEGMRNMPESERVVCIYIPETPRTDGDVRVFIYRRATH
jgi:hypothetical protein